MGKTSPAEDDTAEAAEGHDYWFRGKVEASLADSRPTVSHTTVMAEIDRIITDAEKRSRPN